MRKYLKKIIFFCFAVLLFANAASADTKIRIVATTTVLADLAGQMTGELADIYYIASPRRSLHFINPTPKDVLMVKKADVLIYHGASAEPWLEPLILAAGRIQDFGLEGDSAVDASAGIELLDVPQTLSRMEGDIHPGGNPHYWLNPENVPAMVEAITEALSRLFPEQAPVFRANRGKYLALLRPKIEQWEIQMRPFRRMKFITYHKSWVYFAEAYGLDCVSQLEPKPGIPPGPRHLKNLKAIIRDQDILILIKEPHEESRGPNQLAKDTGIGILELHQFVGADKKISNYMEMMEFNINQLVMRGSS